MAAKLGIVAGSGELPRRLVAACRAQGRPFFVLALAEAADRDAFADVPHGTIRLGAAAEGFRLLRANDVEELVLAGAVRRPRLGAMWPDWRMARFLAKVGYRALGDNGLLSAVIKELEVEGFRVVGADSILSGDLATLGPLGAQRPDAPAWSDIATGIAAARALGARDLGQAVVVRHGIVLGVEAVEGTDALIASCGTARGDEAGGVLVKMSKPGQERRADLPTIGPGTVAAAAQAGLTGIAIEAGATLVLDCDAVIAAADRAGIFVVGVAADAAPP